MKQEFLSHQGTEHLLLFFGGWGTDAHLLDLPSGMDVMMCYDYRSMDFDPSPLLSYRGIHLVAWSFGVWVAGQVLSGLQLPWLSRTALNGTPFPIDDHRGIPQSIFHGTLEGFSDVVLHKFRRRMCGSASSLQTFMAHAPQRTTTDLHQELSALHTAVLQSPSPSSFSWNLALVGKGDRIFPAENQLAAWQDIAQVSHLDIAHYDAELIQHLAAARPLSAFIDQEEVAPR